MSKCRKLLLATAVASVAATPALAERLGIGRAALPEELDAWNVNIMPNGDGLPEGSMSVEDGESAFVDNCAMCHGDFAEGLDNWPPLAGGRGTLTADRPLKTVGSYWPYLSTVWDYVHRSMPFGNAQSLTPDEVYGITAYILYSEGLVDYDFVLSKENFTEVRLPNEDGFYVDDRIEAEFPLFTGEPCMTECKAEVEVTLRAADLNVTPTDEEGHPVGTIPDFTVAAAGAVATDAVEEASAEDAAEGEEDVAEAAEAHDPELVAAGERAFRQCSACHQVGEGAQNRVGPQLNGIIGQPAGQVDGFRYSPALMTKAEEGLVWTEENLAELLEKPRDFIPGTRMSFAGFRDPDDVAAVTAYLKTFSE